MSGGIPPPISRLSKPPRVESSGYPEALYPTQYYQDPNPSYAADPHPIYPYPYQTPGYETWHAVDPTLIDTPSLVPSRAAPPIPVSPSAMMTNPPFSTPQHPIPQHPIPPPISRANKPVWTPESSSSSSSLSSSSSSLSSPSSSLSSSSQPTSQLPSRPTSSHKESSGFWKNLRSGATVLEGALNARKLGKERKSASGDTLALLKARGVSPMAYSDPSLELALRAAVMAKQCSAHGSAEAQQRAIEQLQQRVVALRHLTLPDGAMDPRVSITWFAALSLDPSKPRALSVCFRGTRLVSMTDWAANADASPTALAEPLNVHSGFYHTLLPWYPDLVATITSCFSGDGDQPEELILCGHSKGGSLALVLALLLLHHRPEGVPLDRLRVATFGSPLCTHSWAPREDFLASAQQLLASAPGARVLSFVHECDLVPRTLGGQYNADFLTGSKAAEERPELRESRRYYPLALPPQSTYHFISGGQSGQALVVYEIPPELVSPVLDLPMALVDGFSAAKEAHRMTHYMTKLQRYYIPPHVFENQIGIQSQSQQYQQYQQYQGT